MDNTSVFFTIVACNYIGQALTLGRSLKEHHPEIDFYVFLMDDVDKKYEKDLLAKGFKVIHPKDVNIKNYESLVFKYNVIEASTAVKPSVASYFFETGFEKVMYIDPDIFCYRRLDDLLTYLDQYSIVITPHILTPASEDYLMNDTSFMKVGIYNLGFLALRKSEFSISFLKWWSERLENFCVNAPERSLFVDQKWIDFVPAFFDGVLILKDPAYNIAYWNIRERTLINIDGQTHVTYKNKSTPVALIHFSSFDFNLPDNISKQQKPILQFNNLDIEPKVLFSFQNRPDLVPIWNNYREALMQSNYSSYLSLDYRFNYYSNKEMVSELERVLYLSSEDIQSKFTSPFETGQHSFNELCRKSGVKEAQEFGFKKDTQNQLIGTHHLQSNYLRASKVVYVLIRMAMYLLGTQRYILLSKFLIRQMSLYNHSFLIKF